MIRYVLMLALAATILGLTATALDHASTTRGEQVVEQELAAIEEAALELYRFETVPANAETIGPRRTLTIDLPTQRLSKDGAQIVRFERIDNADATRVTYSVGDGATTQQKISAPIQGPDGGAVDLTAWHSPKQYVLELTTDEQGKRVVVIQPYA